MKMWAAIFVCVALFLTVLGLWLYQSYHYGNGVTTCQQTDDYECYLDRACGYVMDCHTVQPPMPFWASFLRRWSPLTIVGLAILSLILCVYKFDLNNKFTGSRYDRWPQPPVDQ